MNTRVLSVRRYFYPDSAASNGIAAGFDEAQFLPLLTHLSNAAQRFYEIPHYTQLRHTKGTVIAPKG
jgi:hypothetical protein